MSDHDDNVGNTKLVAENGDQMEPAIAGISSPTVPTMERHAADVAVDAEEDEAGEAEMNALHEEDRKADVTVSGAE